MVRGNCACALAAVTAFTGGAASPALAQDSAFLSANLYAEQVVGGGDDDASADWNAEVFTSGRLCYFLDLEELDNASSVAIHRGAAGEEGAVVIALELPGPEGDEVCVTADTALLAEVVAQPDAFYVQIASSRHSNGAVRGQLSE
jgi:CHRD domain